MADRATLLALAERCEAAPGPDRELDGEIWRAVNGWPESAGALMWGAWHLRDPVDTVAFDPPPAFTASIDAALTLVPEGHAVSLHIDADGSVFAGVELDDGDGCDDAWPCGRTPPLALCAAAIRARTQETA